MKTTIEQIRKYVESKTSLDISKKTRDREYVDARALYFKLCRENTTASYDQIGSSVNRDYSTVIHSVRHTFDSIYRFNPLIRNLYDDFMPISVAIPESFSKRDIAALIEENINLKSRIELIETRNGRLYDLVAKVPEHALDDFFTRASAMVTMLQATRYIEPVKVKELKGAEL